MALGPSITQAVLNDFTHAPVDARLGAMLHFLKKVTLEPDSLGVDDGAALRRAGVSQRAATDALMVAFCFNLVTRVADSFGWAVPDQAAFESSARYLLKTGYLLPFRGKPTARQ